MTRIARARSTPRRRKPQPRDRSARPGHWLLQDAKARFSELVRLVRIQGPQRVTVRGRDEVVIISAEDFRRLQGELTGAALVAAMQASPHRSVSFEPDRVRLPVRDVDLS